jgi:peptidyl-prolyl isomerase D
MWYSFLHTYTASLAKALYRRGLANSLLKDDQAAEENLREALRLVPEDQAIANELARVREISKTKREKEKAAFKKMFN